MKTYFRFTAMLLIVVLSSCYPRSKVVKAPDLPSQSEDSREDVPVNDAFCSTTNYIVNNISDNFNSMKDGNDVSTEVTYKYDYYDVVNSAIYEGARKSHLRVDGRYWVWFTTTSSKVEKDTEELAKRIGDCLGRVPTYSPSKYTSSWYFNLSNMSITVTEWSMDNAVLLKFSPN